MFQIEFIYLHDYYTIQIMTPYYSIRQGILVSLLLLMTSSFLDAPEDLRPSSNKRSTEVTHRFDPDEDEQRKEKLWVDSIFKTLTIDQQIGQLFMIRAHSNLGADHTASVKQQIKKYHVGGLCFFQGTPLKQAQLTNQYQALSSHVPLMVAMDAEWGLAMRHKEAAIRYPMQMTLGAINDNSLIYKMGVDIATQLKRIGTHINFAPVVDINNNPDNPVINDRSFGEDRQQVAIKSYMYMIGMQDQGIMACAKHFPGHGDTDMDSHLDLPTIPFDEARLDSLELFPFRVLAQHGVGSMMIAHLQIPVWEKDCVTPSTLSKTIIQKKLIEEMAYQGLIFTDGLEMEGVLKNFPPGEIEVRALMAGNDVLLLPSNIDVAYKAIKLALNEGRLTTAMIEHKVKKILLAKYRMGLNHYCATDIDGLTQDINTPNSKALVQQLYEHALTLLGQHDAVIPYVDVYHKKYASLAIGADTKNDFQSRLEDYAPFEHHHLKKRSTAYTRANMLKRLKEFDRVIIGVHDMSRRPSKQFGLAPWTRDFIKALQSKTHVSVVLFGNPYAIQYLGGIGHILVSYEDNAYTRNASAEALFGAIPIQGSLPVKAGAGAPLSSGLKIGSLRRIGYALPEQVGMDSDSLADLRTLADAMIRTHAAPGARILVVKDRKIIYNQNFGYHTYKKKHKVHTDDIYDLASITKVAAATLSVMKLVDDGLVNLHTPISQYLPHIDTTDKRDLTLYDIMAHHAGLKPWIPFYLNTLTEDHKRTQPSDTIYHQTPDQAYCLKVCDQMYMSKSYADSVWYKIYNSALRSRNDYRYSDLGMYMVADIIKTLTGKAIDQYVQEQFYQPLGLKSIGYNPAKKHPISDVVPTEEDTYFRHRRIQGYVHDMGAAMLGGVSGHAGLFSTAGDLAVLFQMLLNGGYYGGKQYLRPETIELFTTRHKRSTRRGIGFDMKELDTLRTLNMSEMASDRAFGHLGFTGTAVWADPTSDLIFIMLANRTYPTMKNNKFGKENYRPKCHTVCYKAMH